MESEYSCGLKYVKRHEPELTGALLGCLNFSMSKRRGRAAPTETEVQGIARRLKAAREAMELSQADVCRRTGIRPNTYNQWEKALGAPDRLQARLLRKNLGWTLDYIYEGDPSGLPHALAVKLGAGAA